MLPGAKMLLRSSSTPVLSSLIGVPLSALPKQEHVREVERESDSTLRPARMYRSLSFCSTALASAGSSPLPPNLGIGDDTRSLDGSEWDFNGDVFPWPRFKRVQSEGDISCLAPGSALNAAAKYLTSSVSKKQCGEGGNDEVREMCVRGPWSRRMPVRRLSSLSAIPSNSNCGSESDSVDTEGLMKEVQGVLESETSATEEVEKEVEIPEYGSTTNRFRYIGDEAVRESDYLMQMGEYGLPESNGQHTKKHDDIDAGAPDRLELEFRLASEAALDLSAKVASVSGREAHGFNDTGDGERYKTIATAANGTMIVCNSRGCKPVNHSDLAGPMFIAGGFGMGGGLGGGGSRVGTGGGGGRGDSPGTEAYYKRALEADPGHPLLLRNYAKFLHEVKRDTLKAESYYERAILANPGDGELLALYAKLIWDAYKDEERAGSYFDQALQASPDNCYVVAAYASFMWASDAGEDTQEQPIHCNGQGASVVPRFSSVRAS